MAHTIRKTPTLLFAASGLAITLSAVGFSAVPKRIVPPLAKPAAAKPLVAPKKIPEAALSAVQRAGADIALSKGRGQLVTLPMAVSDVMISNPDVADVQVRSPRQIYIFAKASGESSIFAITATGKVAYSANLRVTSNVNSIADMIKLAMPEANVSATAMNGLLLLTGTVATPEDGAEAERLAKALVGSDIEVVNRTKSATPVQVNLQVRIAEVNRQLVRSLGINLMSRDTTGGFLFGVAQGRNFGSIVDQDLSKFPTGDASSLFGQAPGTVSLPIDPVTGNFIRKAGTLYDLKNLAQGSGKTSIGLAGRLLGMDLASAIDLAENEGLATTLAQPNLTAVTGETASFLAGGEIPIPISTQLGQVSIEYKQYGVSLAFTPTVLSDGRISMRVRPEVSQLTTAGAVQLNGYTVPGISTRRVETTVELGSGQSFMIGGLLQNSQNNSTDRAPGLGNLPILGALFRSNEFRKNETELVVVVTPYLVKPVSAADIKLPTDGLLIPSELDRLVTGGSYSGKTGGQRPLPTMAPPVTVKAGAPLSDGPPTNLNAPKARSKDSQSVPVPGFGN